MNENILQRLIERHSIGEASKNLVLTKILCTALIQLISSPSETFAISRRQLLGYVPYTDNVDTPISLRLARERIFPEFF